MKIVKVKKNLCSLRIMVNYIEAKDRLLYFSYFHSVMFNGILLWGKAADIPNYIYFTETGNTCHLFNEVSLRERF